MAYEGAEAKLKEAKEALSEIESSSDVTVVLKPVDNNEGANGGKVILFLYAKDILPQVELLVLSKVTSLTTGQGLVDILALKLLEELGIEREIIDGQRIQLCSSLTARELKADQSLQTQGVSMICENVELNIPEEDRLRFIIERYPESSLTASFMKIGDVAGIPIHIS